MKHVLKLFAFLLFSQSAFASHYLGGEITWRCFDSGPNAGKYKFYVILYRECGTGASTYLPNPVVLSTNAPGGSISCSLVGSGTDVSPNCYLTGSSQPISCGNVASGEGAVWEQRYESGYITLSGVPPAGGWYFTFTDCCRPSITNLTSASSSYTLRAYMYPYTINGVPQNANPCYDNSPRFLEPPKSVICSGYDYTYAHNAFDNDLDSISYQWAYPQTTSNGVNATFNTGYSFNNPFPNNGNTVNFNAQTGAINFNPSAGGSFASCVEVNAYRCGQKIASVYRDIPVIIKSNCGFNTPPDVVVANIPLMPQLSPVVVAGDTLYYEATVYAGDSIAFHVNAQDAELLPNGALQTIEFAPSGGQLGSPLGNALSGCLAPPCATIKPKSPQTSLLSALNNEVTFGWRTDCNHISYQSTNCGTPTNRYVFALRMQDDFCPAPAISVASVVINVVSTIPVPPDLSQACVTQEPSGGLTIDWGYPLDTGMNFDAYVVFRGGSPSVPFAAIDTIWNYSDQSYTDMTPLSGANYYYMRTLGGCGYTSVTSDTIRLMEMAVTPIPPTNSSVAQLDWNAPYTGATPTYEIWRRPQGTGATGWAQVATTTNVTFNDTVNICGQDLEYQIRINGSCNSTIDGGFFSDQNNTDVLKIDSVSVNGGTALISWTPGTNGDIVNYDILEWVPGTGWNSIATLPNTVSMPYPLPGATPGSSVKRYKVMSTDSCGNQSSDLLVASHNNILLTENMDPCDGIMRLRWNQYRGWAGGVKEYRVLADVTPPGGPTQMGVLLATKSPGDTAFNTRDLIGGWSYCYYIKAVDTAGQRFSSSNEVCINSLAVQRSRLLYLAKASVRSDNAVELVTFIDKDADIVHFDLQRADRYGAPFTSLGLIPKPISPPWEIRFKDFSADPENHRYEYRFVATDSCGGIDTASNIATNILLKVEPEDNLTNILTWNSYRDFMGGVLKYDIYRSTGVAGRMDFIGTTTDTIYTDNIRPLGNNVGLFCYKVVATEGPSPLMFVDYDGSIFTSTSNIACGGEHDPRVFFPNSFNPNSNVAENRIWRPKHIYVEDATYRLEIYDRWGSLVFSTNDFLEGWDGTIGNQIAPEGSYIYQLNYRSKQGEPVDLRGTLLLIY